MTSAPDPDSETRAGKRFLILNLVRIASLMAVLAGIAGAQNALPLPYPLAVVVAVGGFLGFFFGPYYLAKYFKAEDSKRRR